MPTLRRTESQAQPPAGLLGVRAALILLLSVGGSVGSGLATGLMVAAAAGGLVGAIAGASVACATAVVLARALQDVISTQ